jgi:hypothetical protein
MGDDRRSFSRNLNRFVRAGLRASGGGGNRFTEATGEIGEETTGGRTPLGVTKGFVAQNAPGRIISTRQLQEGAYPTTTHRQAPRYFKDDEFRPANFHPTEISSIQQELAFVGLYQDNDYVVAGDWGPDTAAAFKRLLGYANQHGMTWRDALANIRAGIGAGAPGPGGEGGGGGGGGGGTGGGGGRFRIDESGNIVPIAEDIPERAPLVARTTDPRTVALVMREAAMNLLGEGLNNETTQGLVQAFNQMEVQRQQAAYDTQLTGGTVVDIPSTEAFAQAELESKYPEQVKAWRMTEFGQNALQLLASPAWGIE